MRVLLDTNIVSELVAKQPNPKVLEWIDSLDANAVYLPVITIGELRHGIETLPESKRKNNLRHWLDEELSLRFYGRILTIDSEVMMAWGVLMAQLEREGRPMPAMDSLIAAIAIRHDCVLATRNNEDFAACGIPTINPWT